MNILKWVHKWTRFLQFHWNTLVRIPKSKVQISFTTKSHLSEITSFCSNVPKKLRSFYKNLHDFNTDMGHRSTVKFTHYETCKLLWIFTLFLKNLVYKSYLQDPNYTRAKLGVSPRLQIWPCDLDLWLWKSIGFQILLRTKYVPSLVKIHWRMLILECSQGCYAVTFWPDYLDLWPMRLWPWKSIGFRLS